jgi:dCTP diphosphatase
VDQVEQGTGGVGLASALIVEAAELMEHFQWMAEAQSHALSPGQREAMGTEVADVLLYLIQLSTVLGFDPIAAAQAKLKLNALKYPVELAKCSSKNYDALGGGVAPDTSGA